MLPISTSNGAVALLVLRQAADASPSRAGNAVGGALEAAANGLLPTGGSGTGRVSIDAQGKITQSLFSVHSVDVTKLKVNLMERLGKELDLDMNDFESAADFGRAVKQAINALKMSEDGHLKLAEIERKLELDKLGISLDELVEAIGDPDGDADKKLEAALLKQAGGNDMQDPDATTLYHW